MWVYHDLFFATRIQINVSWSGSGPGQIIRIRNTDAKPTGLIGNTLGEHDTALWRVTSFSVDRAL